MNNLSYGLNDPSDLLKKLKHDAEHIEPEFHPYSIFNFVLTSACLNEWIIKYYRSIIPNELSTGLDPRNDNNLPNDTEKLISDSSCLPNRGHRILPQVKDCICICSLVANASKHFHWHKGIESIGSEPIINSWYKYYFTRTGPGIYIEYKGANYCITQIRDILVQFYSNLLPYIENKYKEALKD